MALAMSEPTGKLTALPITPTWVYGWGPRDEGRREKERREGKRQITATVTYCQWRRSGQAARPDVTQWTLRRIMHVVSLDQGPLPGLTVFHHFQDITSLLIKSKRPSALLQFNKKSKT